MRPVMMTSFGWPDGNCFAACMASIFEVPLSEPTPCPHMADRLAEAESMQPRNASAPGVDAFDQAVEESGLV